jgi:hypothetical protein
VSRSARPRAHAARSGRYTPERGDAIWLDFDPQAGHEQGGRRPALVLSPASGLPSSARSRIKPKATRSRSRSPQASPSQGSSWRTR